jgi:hypothetical protein
MEKKLILKKNENLRRKKELKQNIILRMIKTKKTLIIGL